MLRTALAFALLALASASNMTAAAGTMVVYGGRAIDPARPFGDMWFLDLGRKQWAGPHNAPEFPSGPGARFGHSAPKNAAGEAVIWGGWNVQEPWFMKTNGAQVEFRYSGATGTPPQPRTLHGGSVVTSGGAEHLVVFGGFSGNSEFLNDVWSVPLSQGGQWRQQTPTGGPPHARTSFTANTIDNEMIIFGGAWGTMAPRFFNDVWSYNLDRNTWRQLSNNDGPSPRFSHSAAVFRNELYVFGGGSGAGRFYNDFWVFNTQRPAWRLLQTRNDPSPRMYHSGAVVDSTYVIFGGSLRTGMLNEAWEFDLTTNTWTQIRPTGPSARFYHSANIF